MRYNRVKWLSLVAGCVLGFNATAQTTEATNSEAAAGANAGEADEWRFVVAPLYLWAVGIEGDSSVGPLSVPVNVEFKDVLSNLEGIFTIHGDARYRNWTLFTDWTDLSIGPEAETPTGVPLSVTIDSTILEFGGGYRLRQASPAVDVIAGLRYNRLRQVVSGAPVGIDERWYDGFGGMRAIYHLGKEDQWRLLARGDVGAGGSDLTWSTTLLAAYQFKEWFGVNAGYKWLGVDYNNGQSGRNRFEYDVIYQGPMGGVEFTW